MLPTQVRKKVGDIVDEVFQETKNVLDQLEEAPSESTQSQTEVVFAKKIIVTDLSAYGLIVDVALKLKDIGGKVDEKLVDIRVEMPNYEPLRVCVNGKTFKMIETD